MFVTTNPVTRALFGATVITEGYRAPNQVDGEPAFVTPYPWTTFEGAHRSFKLGWNQGDQLLADVAQKLGYDKARYTPEENALMIKALGRFLGSSDVGICRVDPRWFYSHSLIAGGQPIMLENARDLKYGIQLFTDQNWTRVINDAGTGWWSISKSGMSYANSAWMAIMMAQMLRDMGYEARVGFGGMSYETIETPFSVYNALGEYGRLSDAVVPSVGGLRFKSATILTNFPMQPDPERASYGITRFCDYCDRCARACPVDAIPLGGPTVANGVLMWHVDKDKCARFRIGNLNGNCCNECLKVCPYNKPNNAFHRLGNYMVKHSPLAPKLFGSVNGVGLEDWLEYDYSTSRDFGINRPARWILEEPGYKNQFPRQYRNYIYTEEDRSTVEEWATGVGAMKGKVRLSYRGTVFGEVPKHFYDATGRHRNVHWDYPEGELGKNIENIGEVLTEWEARRRLLAGEAWSGGWYKKDEDIFPPRSQKYEKQFLTYRQAADMWAKE
jgi:ferredoxin